ncbi:hypothetical protein [Larkinella knui]|uniref:Uncharacterized protein n=1 Tax=Larkinella knui TaxID=2025310 RepID=A0A3P1CMK4_9BACT|nr:hypothetical protein [Larkinella knui]RRB14154.1 hypothetical protein EHT87_18115 [Larkinella knui]
MKLDDFLRLSHGHQQEQLWFRGSVLANRYEDTHIYLLYALDLFYVELQYDAAGSKLLRLSAFTSTEPLTPYLPLLPDDLLAELG